MKKKLCPTCKKRARLSYNARCRPCMNEYMRNYRKAHHERIKEIRRASRTFIYHNSKLQQWKEFAHRAVRYALRNGTLKKKLCCVSRCRKEAEAHHDSYLEKDWLNVRWLCQDHHALWHRKNKPYLPTKLKV